MGLANKPGTDVEPTCSIRWATPPSSPIRVRRHRSKEIPHPGSCSGTCRLLERVGLQLRSRDDLHRYFRPFPERPRDVHVHVCAVGSDWEREHLLFRDYLRSDPEARAAYADAKREAALTWSDDGVAYTEAKSEIILSILEKAARWSLRSGHEASGGDQV